MRNGLDAAKLIREKNRDAIIYILTAYSQFEYAHQALQTQVAGYLLKPIKPAELVDTLKKGIAVRAQSADVQPPPPAYGAAN